MQYTVGDKVKIIKNNCGHHFKLGEIVTITKVNSTNYYAANREGSQWYIRDTEVEPFYEVVNCKTKNYDKSNIELHITTAGRYTYGVLKENGVVTKRAGAKCHEADEFDFKVGTQLVMQRLGLTNNNSQAKYEYYNGDVVGIVNSEADSITKGKIYHIKDGRFIDDIGKLRPMTFPLINLNGWEDIIIPIVK